MYIPHHFRLEDHDAVIAFMKQYNFGMLTTVADGRPQATHLPFHIHATEDRILLTAHMAKANPQWKDIEQQEALIVFSGPHAYISPANYEKEQNVPTWNYVAVHAYGKVRIVHDEQRGFEILEEMMLQSEPGYMEQWRRLEPAYKNGLFKGIVPFEITVTELQAKHKLSQNKTVTERGNIIHSLAQSGDGAAQDIANYMQENEPKMRTEH